MTDIELALQLRAWAEDQAALARAHGLTEAIWAFQSVVDYINTFKIEVKADDQ